MTFGKFFRAVLPPSNRLVQEVRYIETHLAYLLISSNAQNPGRGQNPGRVQNLSRVLNPGRGQKISGDPPLHKVSNAFYLCLTFVSLISLITPLPKKPNGIAPGYKIDFGKLKIRVMVAVFFNATNHPTRAKWTLC